MKPWRVFVNQELIEIFNEIGDPLLIDNRDSLCKSLDKATYSCMGIKCENCLLRLAENSWYKTIEVIHEQAKQGESQ